MGAKTEIAWTDSTWNPLKGTKGRWHCTKVSEACDHCYAERMNVRFGGPKYRVGADDFQFNDRTLGDPIRWRRPRKIFVCSMTDLFHEDIPDHMIDRVFGIMAACRFSERHHHVFQVLTKRAKRMADYLNQNRKREWADEAVHEYGGKDPDGLFDAIQFMPMDIPENIWVGVTVENQARAEERVPHLLEVPAAVRWMSVEPMLEPIRLAPWIHRLDWVVVGGESGPQARPMDLGWARGLKGQCDGSMTPFFFKQTGGRGPKRNWAPVPPDLDIREFPR